MELGERSDNEEQAIPDIIISRSSIPDAERARNIRMIPMLEEYQEESDTDSSKESGASDDDGDNFEHFKQTTQPPSDNNTETAETKMDDNLTSSQSPQLQSEVHVQRDVLDVPDVTSLSAAKADDASVNIFPTPNVEEFFSEYEDATEDEQVLIADQAHQFKADTTAFQHLENVTANEQDNTDKFCEGCNK